MTVAVITLQLSPAAEYISSVQLTCPLALAIASVNGFVYSSMHEYEMLGRERRLLSWISRSDTTITKECSAAAPDLSQHNFTNKISVNLSWVTSLQFKSVIHLVWDRSRFWLVKLELNVS